MFFQIVHAQNSGAGDAFIQGLATEIVNPIIIFLIVLALVVFLWGIAEFVRGADNASSRETGKIHMLWGIIGLFIMVSAYAIMKIVMNSVYG